MRAGEGASAYEWLLDVLETWDDVDWLRLERVERSVVRSISPVLLNKSWAVVAENGRMEKEN